MRLSVVLAVLTLLLAACDLKPPPKQRAQEAAQPSEPEPAPQEAQAPAGPSADAGAQVSEECLDVAAHIAAILIADAKDPSQKAALEQDRTKIIRRSAEGCTRDGWTAEARACFTKATSTAEMQICGRALRPAAAQDERLDKGER